MLAVLIKEISSFNPQPRDSIIRTTILVDHLDLYHHNIDCGLGEIVAYHRVVLEPSVSETGGSLEKRRNE